MKYLFIEIHKKTMNKKQIKTTFQEKENINKQNLKNSRQDYNKILRNITNIDYIVLT